MSRPTIGRDIVLGVAMTGRGRRSLVWGLLRSATIPAMTCEAATHHDAADSAYFSRDIELVAIVTASISCAETNGFSKNATQPSAIAA